MKVILEAQHAVGHPQLRGVGYYSLELIRALLKRKRFDYELTFFDYNKEMGNMERADRYFGEYNVPIHECNELDYRIASRDESVFSQKSYNDYTNTYGDVYHFMCPVSVPTNLKGNMIVTIHDVIGETVPGSMTDHTLKLHRIAAERYNRLNPLIVTDSEASKREILKYSKISENRIKVVYLSYDEQNMYYDETNVSDIVEGEYFLFVGALVRSKNLVRIIEAYNIVAEKNKSVKLVIAGKKAWDSYEELYRSVSESKYKDRIIFAGYVDNNDKRRLYSNACALVFPSLCEGFGIPVLEAMACGCPVITADNSSLPEVGGDAAVYVDAYNTEQLAYEMERVLLNDSLRKEMSARGFAQKDKFSWEKTAEQMEKYYTRVMEMNE